MATGLTFAFLGASLLLGRFVHRRLLGRFGAGTLQHLVRLPGNLLHELAHAGVMIGTGYTIDGFTVSLLDPSGRGHVVPGRPWAPFARPWLTNLLSPLAPAVVGLAALAGLHALSGMPALPTTLAGVMPALAAVPWTRWQVWLALAVGFSVAAEMAPSDVDLGVWWRPALVVAILAGAAVYGVEALRPGTGVALLGAASDAFGRSGVAPLAGRAFTLTLASALAVAPLALARSALTRQ